tara:strand:- start:8986 stop:9816 length:831 start_codon:yes stop_codon:yes gene_type:complete
MCLLVVCEPDGTPKQEELHAGACSNPHGYGFAIVAGSEIISERSMSAKKSIKRFLELREQYPEGYAMWHARYATHGVKNEENCHPFKVGDSELTYLAHNGILDVAIPEGDKRSDSRILAEDILPKIGGVASLDDDTIWSMLSKWASGSKIAVINLDPSASSQMYIINENLGAWDSNGVWWSNGSHKRVTYKPPTTTLYDNDYWTKKYDDIPVLDDSVEEVLDFCPFCQALIDLNESQFFCELCDTCFDCEQGLMNCLCYTPKSKWHSERSLDDFYI